MRSLDAPPPPASTGGGRIIKLAKLNTKHRTTVNYRDLVESATLADLVEALADPGDFFAVDFFSDGTATKDDEHVWFRCPIHGERRSAGHGHAHGHPAGEFWSCSDRLACGARSTRYLLERLVLESGDALHRIVSLMEGS